MARNMRHWTIYVFVVLIDNHIYHDAGASIRDNNTTFINRHGMHEDVCHGLALENYAY